MISCTIKLVETINMDTVQDKNKVDIKREPGGRLGTSYFDINSINNGERSLKDNSFCLQI